MADQECALKVSADLFVGVKKCSVKCHIMADQECLCKTSADFLVGIGLASLRFTDFFSHGTTS